MKLNLPHQYPLVVIFIIGLVIYANSLAGQFQFDDAEYIVNNSAIRDITDITAIYDAHPVPTRFIGFLSFALNFHIHDLHVFGYHAVNLLIHLINAFLVYWLAGLILSTRHLGDEWVDENKLIFSFAVSLLFLAHPIQTQAVSYITQRFASLATLFYLLSLCCYFKGRLANDRVGWGGSYIGFAFIAGLCAMLTKQIALTLPAMVVLCEVYFFHDRTNLFRSKRLWGIICIAFILMLIIPGFYGNKVIGIVSNKLASGSHEGDLITSQTYLLTQFRVVVKYLQLLFLPIQQNLDYDFQMTSNFFELKTVLSFILLLSLLIYARMVSRKIPLLSFGIFWFFITLSVESSFIPIRHVIFEHRLYLPFFGFALCVVYLLFVNIKSRQLFISVVAGMVAVCSMLTINRNQVWRSEISLWSDVVKKSPKKYRGYLNLGKAYSHQRNYRLALTNLNKSIKLKPDNFDAYNYRGLMLYDQGLHSLAIDDYTKALEINSRFISALVNRGNVYRRIGHNNKALADYHQAVSIKPTDYRIYVNRGIVHAKMRSFELALKDFHQVQQLNPKFTDIYKNIGNVYEIQGRYQMALTEYQKVLEFSPRDVDAFISIGTVYSRLNQNKEAIKAFDNALGINPQRPDAYYKRSFLHYAQQNFELAFDDIIRAQYLGQKVDDRYINRLKHAVNK